MCSHHDDGSRSAEQVYDVLRWASSDDRDWDGSRLCVGGQSAGGNLAAAASRLALEQGGPNIALQVLHYAPLDLVTPGKAKRSPLGSRAILRPWMSEVFDTAYVPDVDRRAGPVGVTGLGHERDRFARHRAGARRHRRVRPASRRRRFLRSRSRRGRITGGAS